MKNDNLALSNSIDTTSNNPPKLPNLPDWYDDTIHMVAKNGAIRSKVTGRIVSGKNITTKITPDNSDKLRQHWLNSKLNNQVLGIIKGLGIDVDENDIQDVQVKAELARRALYEKLTKVYMQSEDIRGMSVALETLIKADTSGKGDNSTDNKVSNTLILLVNKYIQQASEDSSSSSSSVIDGSIVE